MEAECPQKKVNTVPGNYEISMEIEGEENVPVVKPKLREKTKEVITSKRTPSSPERGRGRPRYFDPFYYRSRSPECEEQRKVTFRNNIVEKRSCGKENQSVMSVKYSQSCGDKPDTVAKFIRDSESFKNLNHG